MAIQHAVNGLLAGDCDLALTGGAQVWMPVATMNLFCRLGALSHRQRLRAFAEDADGTLLGEGIGMVVLKRLEDAVRDGDRVYAVIRGVGVSSDGRGLGVMAPRVEGEELALRRAYEDAGVSPESVGLLEAHGTGTPVGDATEIQALTRVFGERGQDLLARTAIGSVKSMISHTIPAAGVAGVIKTALALHQRVLPPTLADRPNPKLELEQTPFYLNTETRPWIHGGSEPRRAGVNAFGFGGINAHAVLEEYDDPAAAAHRPAWDTELFILEAESAAGLVEQATELIAALERDHQFTLAAAGVHAVARRWAASRRRESGWRSSPTPRRSWRPSCARRSTSSPIRPASGSRPSAASTTNPSRSAATRRSCSSSRARARSTRACWPTCACTFPRRAPCSTGSIASTPTTRAVTCSATGCSRGRRSPTPSANTPSDG